MGRAVLVACVLAGCYAPRAFPGAPCSPGGECPDGLACIANVCELPGGTTTADAELRSSDAGGAVLDAPPDAEGPPGPHGWHAATRIPGVNTTSTETYPSFTEDQLTIVFTSDRAGTGGLDLYIGTRDALGQPFAVRELAELNSTADDQSPEISQDGTAIFFTTSRGGAGSLVYSATRASTAVPFGAPAEVTSLSKDHDGDTQNSIQIGVSPDLEMAMVIQVKNAKNASEGYDRGSITGQWTDEEELTGMELASDISGPSLTDDAAIVYFASGTPAQIFETAYTESSDTFSTPVSISELNLGTRDASPEISAGGTHLVFERDSDLYEATK